MIFEGLKDNEKVVVAQPSPKIQTTPRNTESLYYARLYRDMY
jgi:hypothetical protein